MYTVPTPPRASQDGVYFDRLRFVLGEGECRFDDVAQQGGNAPPEQGGEGPPPCVASQFEGICTDAGCDDSRVIPLVCGTGDATLDTSTCGSEELASIEQFRADVCACADEMVGCFSSTDCSTLMGDENMDMDDCVNNAECSTLMQCVDDPAGDDGTASEQPDAGVSSTGEPDTATPSWLSRGWRVVLKTNGDETFGCATTHHAAAW